MKARTKISWAKPPPGFQKAAKMLGISVEEYESRRRAGEKACFDCGEWKKPEDFNRDSSRIDGRNARCRPCQRKATNASYVKTGPRKKGRKLVTPRDGDKKQARGRVHSLIAAGLLPRASTQPCSDCGKPQEKHRHEYHHHLGYEAKNHENVVVLCAKCHHRKHDQ